MIKKSERILIFTVLFAVLLGVVYLAFGRRRTSVKHWQSCADDVWNQCRDFVGPGKVAGMNVVMCLSKHKNQLSPACRTWFDSRYAALDQAVKDKAKKKAE
ncbi:hypothetical protein E3A20_04830 [Planctomyces bekefii]|uniref:Uncharacterized protein n=1 Tax=Planctomyces bekefii TaxID=1653850 RepID=A0A5C6M9N7_9PLAN|nr:hypothetical protein E3A20_04830 [Planctomyces bekefii]